MKFPSSDFLSELRGVYIIFILQNIIVTVQIGIWG
jgi:hypothetical protein